MKKSNNWVAFGLAAIGLCLAVILPSRSLAQELAPTEAANERGQETESFDTHFQATYVWQRHGSFNAPYTGPNSLIPLRERGYTFSATLFFGARLWQGAELYLNPEVVQGVALSELTGLGGLTNGENQKTTGPTPTFYRARLFVRQTWDLGGEKERVESAANQLAGWIGKRRLVLTAGNLAVIDIFDINPYAHDPRLHFLNWSFYTHGAYDFAADARGYTWGVALEYYRDCWALRVGRFLEPKESNGLPLDYSIMRHHGDQIEIERTYEFLGQAGTIRLLAYRNFAPMGGYRDALAYAAQHGGTPDVANVRRDQAKFGFGVNLDQKLSQDLGLMMRASWNNGELEEYAFTEIDRSFTAGIKLAGTLWARPDDSVFAGLIRNEISPAHREYLAAGGLGFFLGDGRLNYQPERTAEVMYLAKVAKVAWLALDFQHIRNPGYNADRGPVNVWGMRAHLEF